MWMLLVIVIISNVYGKTFEKENNIENIYTIL